MIRKNPLVDGDLCLSFPIYHTVSCCWVGTQFFPQPAVPPKTDRQTLHCVQVVTLLRDFFRVKSQERRKPTTPTTFPSQAIFFLCTCGGSKSQVWGPRSAQSPFITQATQPAASTPKHAGFRSSAMKDCMLSAAALSSLFLIKPGGGGNFSL